MQRHNPIGKLARWVFGRTKRPIWLAIKALTGARTQATAEYYDFARYGGVFDASLEAIAPRLPPGFVACEARPGVVEIEIWCAEYRRIDVVRPYNELGVLVPVRFTPPEGAPVEGMYVLAMAVTTEEARWCGADNYGFPKILADIAITDSGDGKTCVVRDRGIHVLTLRVGAGAVEAFEQPATLLTVRDDHRVIESHFDPTGERGSVSASLAVGLELGTHPIADELRQLDVRVASGRALYMPRLHAVLSRGTDLGPLPEAAQPSPAIVAAPSAPTPVAAHN